MKKKINYNQMKNLPDIELNTFACACYEQNTIEELKESPLKIDKSELKIWNLTRAQYRDQILLAIAHRERDAVGDSDN